MPDRSERRILKALRQGQREAYASVVDAHYPSVYRFLLFLGHDASLAEDLTQEVFASAWRVYATDHNSPRPADTNLCDMNSLR